MIGVPLVDGPFVGEREESTDLVAHRESDDQAGTDAELRQPFVLPARSLRRVAGIRDLDDSQMTQVLPEPWPVLQRIVLERRGIAAGEHSARGKDCIDGRDFVIEQRDEGGIATGRIGQFGDSAAQLFEIGVRIEVLDVDGDLGLQRIDCATGAFADSGSPSFRNRVTHFAARRCAHRATITAVRAYIECSSPIIRRGSF